MSAWKRMLAPLERRVRLMVARGVIAAVNDALKLQGVQIQLLADEASGELERFQQYGYTSRPHPGAEAVAVFAGGLRDHGLVIAVDDRRYRLQGLAEGEVAIYDDLGSKIVMKRGNIIEVTAATKVRMVTPLLEVTGDILDNASMNARTSKGMRDQYNLHTHNDPQGGATGVPNQGM